jgi:O-antigen/teichoic acid export membrane protein
LLIVLAMVAATAIALAIQWGLMRPKIAAEVPAGPASRDMRLWLTVSSPVLIGNLGSIIMLSADVIALWLFVGSSQAGIYFAAIKSLVLVQFVAYAVANASAHRVAALHAREEHEELRRFVLRACVMTFLPSLAIAVALVGLGPFILALFGDAFVEGWPAMVIVACGYLVVAAVGPAERVLYMIGAERACARVYLACGAAAVILNLVLVPIYGIMGAASALAMVLVLEAALLAILLRSHLRRSARRHDGALAGPERVENAPAG